MRQYAAAIALVAGCLALSTTAAAQTPAPDASRPWEIVDNSFLLEEAFNQDPGVVQNIFTWTRSRDGTWEASFTQEWPAPGKTHQLSYTVPFANTGEARGIGDVMLNYRYQVREESPGGPAIAPRVSVVLPTGRTADGLGNGTAGVQVNVAISKQFGDLYVHANVGHTWLPNAVNTPQVAGSGIWRAGPRVNLLLEGVVLLGESATLSPGVRGGWNLGNGQIVIGAAVPVTRAGGHASAAILTYFSYELGFLHHS